MKVRKSIGPGQTTKTGKVWKTGKIPPVWHRETIDALKALRPLDGPPPVANWFADVVNPRLQGKAAGSMVDWQDNIREYNKVSGYR